MKTRTVLMSMLTALLVSVGGLKACYTAENYQYQQQLNTMKANHPTPPPIHTPIAHKQLVQEGYTVHYWVSGNPQGATLVMLHPAFGDHRCFDAQLDYFAPNYRVITLDMLGHGLTGVGKAKDNITATAAHVAAILQAEHIAQAHVVGVSLGGLMAQDFARQYPSQTLSVCAVGGYNINQEQPQIAKAQRAEMFKWLFKVIFSMDAFRRYVAHNSTLPQVQAQLYQSAQGFTRKSFTVMGGLDKLIAHRPEVTYAYPLLIMVGEHDLPLAHQMAAQWHTAIPQSQLYQVPLAGHVANMDNAQEFNAQLAEWLNATHPLQHHGQNQ